MFKVSFKETPKDPSKVVTRIGNKTTVILKGTVRLPAFFKDIPVEILDWISGIEKVELYENIVDNTLTVYSTGVAKCMEGDTYDYVLGERIAESRAKYCIYKFFFDLSLKLFDYYSALIFGKEGVVGKGSPGCIERDVKKYEALCIREAHHLGELLNN